MCLLAFLVGCGSGLSDAKRHKDKQTQYGDRIDKLYDTIFGECFDGMLIGKDPIERQKKFELFKKIELEINILQCAMADNY